MNVTMEQVYNFLSLVASSLVLTSVEVAIGGLLKLLVLRRIELRLDLYIMESWNSSWRRDLLKRVMFLSLVPKS